MQTRTFRWTNLSPVLRKTVVILCIGLGVLSVASRVRFTLSPQGVTNDFTQDYIAARAWSDGLDPYTHEGSLVQRYLGSDAANFDLDPAGQHRTPHPPAMLVVMRAVSWLPYKGSRMVWLLMAALITALALGWFARLIGASTRASVVIGVASLAIPVVQTDLIYGQSNGILLLLLVAAWSALRQKHDGLAGAALGLATALKLFPLLMILPLLGKHRLRAASWQLASATTISAAAGGVVGFHVTWEFIRHVSPDNIRLWRGAPINLSLLSIPYRWLTRSIWRPHAVDMPALAGLLALLLLLLLVALAFRGSAAITGDSFWETIPLMLLAVPTLWETYLVLTVPLSFLVVRRILLAEPMPLRWLVLGGSALVSIGLWPGLPAALHTSATMQVLGFSWPLYGLFAIALVGSLGGMSNGARLTAMLATENKVDLV
jgi:MFS family permease